METQKSLSAEQGQLDDVTEHREKIKPDKTPQLLGMKFTPPKDKF
jgi:hypothetical protein